MHCTPKLINHDFPELFHRTVCIVQLRKSFFPNIETALRKFVSGAIKSFATSKCPANFAVRFFPAREIFSQTSGKARDFLRRGKAFVFEAIMKGSSTSLPRVKCVLIFGDRPNFSLFLFFFRYRLFYLRLFLFNNPRRIFSVMAFRVCEGVRSFDRHDRVDELNTWFIIVG